MYPRKLVSSWRFVFLSFMLLILAIGLVWRMVNLAVFKRRFLLEESNQRVLRRVKTPAYRGMIVDRRGEALAISTPVAAVWVNPKLFKIKNIHQFLSLSHMLDYTPDQLHRRIHRHRHHTFLYLKRNISPDIVQKMKRWKLPGLFFEKSFHRYYPHGPVTAHVVGRTDVDDKGQEGLELAYNGWLSGRSGKAWVLKDRLGRVIQKIQIIQEAQTGHTLTLSLDERIQYLAYRSLQDAVVATHAQWGSVVVLDVQTGEILAMTNIPSYNPNRRPKHTVMDGRYRNRAVTDLFEPGSTLKTFAVMNALESGLYHPDTLIDTHPGRLLLEGHMINDEGLDYGLISLTQVLQKSSNIGISKVVLSLPRYPLWKLLNRFGFGQRTVSGFPGEGSGFVSHPSSEHPLGQATLSFGYGLSTTTLQLAKAYAVLATLGVSRPVSFLKVTRPVPGKRIIARPIAQKTLHMLQSVVEKGGTGYLAKIPGYKVGGKTGTAYLSTSHGYDKKLYLSSFVGVAPLNHPRFVVAVVIKRPLYHHYGGIIAAPIFAKVMAGALKFYNISASSP